MAFTFLFYLGVFRLVSDGAPFGFTILCLRPQSLAMVAALLRHLLRILCLRNSVAV